MTSWISDNFKTQELCDKAVKKYPLTEVSDHLKTQEMCNKAAEKDLCSFMNIRDRFKKQGICTEALEKYRFYWNSPLIILRHKKCVTKQLE